MKNNIIVISLIVIISLITILIVSQLLKESSPKDFVTCLERNNVVIYGTDNNCPSCQSLLSNFKNSENIDSIYVSCDREAERCSREMKTSSVPEIQIKGEVYNYYKFEDLAEITGCEIN